MAGSSKHPIVHFVGSIPLPDAETVFRTLADVAAPYLLRLPDGETGIRKDLDPLPPGRARRKSSDRARHGGSAIQVRTMGR